MRKKNNNRQMKLLKRINYQMTCVKNDPYKNEKVAALLLPCCSSVAASLQQLDMYATSGDDKVAN